ncbi:MAG: rRNA cytosine-C5-methyltransferase [Tannerellaceae bacterium]|jgi:16S rRNA C967 or C1407 C5-methylase (RsmB/RsmF family)/NOL1/NOP2/fmu family ribosome biogenesis protein|nr:rRNA cytosine-C5-methyltransferase [Tannerellaceae bacterium]
MSIEKKMLPADFIARTLALLGGAGAYELLEEALEREAEVSIRLNPDKRPNQDKKAEGSPGERVAWCETGYYLPERIAFTFDPLLHAGAYYVQEASSMFVEQAVKAYVAAPVICLDLCAAPGGKSTHLSSILPEGSLLVSNEVIRSRANILAENLCKWGNPHVIVTRNDPAEIGRLRHFFDLVVADAPCSGEGMFRKDPHSAGEWSLANVTLCAARQRRILHDVWDALKPGGLLIYSTCTYNTEENEDNLAYLIETLGAEPLPVAAHPDWQVGGALKHPYPASRFFPHLTRGEGFFLAVVRKAAAQPGGPSPSKLRKEKRRPPAPIPPEAARRLLNPENYRLERCGDLLQAIPLCHSEPYRLLSGQLQLLASGVCLGAFKGNDLLPTHSLAMSQALNREAFASVELSREEAIRYLSREMIPLSGGKGYALAMHQGLPLGFVKLLGNRANNLYPQEWRIRSRQRNS